MAAVSRPNGQNASGFTYITSLNTPAVRNLVGPRIAQAFDQIVTSMRITAASHPVILRQEVPLERWFLDHGLTEPFPTTQAELSARGWAILAALEGAVRTLVEAVHILISRYLNNDDADASRHELVFATQLKALVLSGYAIVSPTGLKEKIRNAPLFENPPLGYDATGQRPWGTPYFGIMTIPAFALDCSDYPWPAQGAPSSSGGIPPRA